MKKIIIVIITAMMFMGCTASQQRELKTLQSDWSGGLERIVTVYNYDGSVLVTYEGKIDIQSSEGGKVLFDHGDKRYIYYNMPISVIEK